MTMGPEPMIRMVEMSVRLGIIRARPVGRVRRRNFSRVDQAGDEVAMTLCAGGSMSNAATRCGLLLVTLVLLGLGGCAAKPSAPEMKAPGAAAGAQQVDWP